jgi:hypothetical protein
VVLKNFKGDRYVYRQPEGIPPHRGGVHDPEYLIQPVLNDPG